MCFFFFFDPFKVRIISSICSSGAASLFRRPGQASVIPEYPLKNVTISSDGLNKHPKKKEKKREGKKKSIWLDGISNPRGSVPGRKYNIVLEDAGIHLRRSLSLRAETRRRNGSSGLKPGAAHSSKKH